ncbi:MAG: restriction endonuclease subunit S, partial [Candidatus Methanoperedens sp.]
AVTRGLDPSVRLKSSGINWLGDIPEHWEVWQIGHFAKVGNGSTPSRGNASYWSESAYPWLNSASVNQFTITKADQFVTELALRECHLPKVQPGSVLVAITGQGKTRGTAAVLNIEATINQHMAYISPITARVLSDYLQMFLITAYTELRSISEDSGSTKGALTCEAIKHFKVALPPTDEQHRLVCAVRQEFAENEATVMRVRREIDLLREYRTRLISDVVTGKLDVRGVELPAMDEAETIEDIDTIEDIETESEELIETEEVANADN